VTLSTIPALRAIANDIIVDVLLYLTPNYCYDVLISVTEQINTVYGIFTKTFPDFESNGGKASLVGHSLGSVICWDLLSVLKDSKENIRGKDGHGAHLTTSRDVDNAVNINYTQFVSPVKLEETSDAATNNDESEGKHDGREGAWGPALPRKIEQVLKFTPEFTIFLGSPIGLFLTLRGAHGLFDSMRENDDALPSPFTLPCRSTYNIFSPSDPVAYRIEPLLLPLDTPKADIPEPAYLTRLGEDVRFHVKAMQLGDEISKVFTNKRGSVSSFFTSITEQAQSALSQIEASTLLSSRITMMEPSSSNKRSKGSNEDDKNHIRFPLGGRSGRVDFQIQPRVIESEYISAVTAHSSYFQNTDVIDFIIDLVHREEEIIDLTTDDHVVGSIDCNKTN
jgi:phospholipase DDHD1